MNKRISAVIIAVMLSFAFAPMPLAEELEINAGASQVQAAASTGVLSAENPAPGTENEAANGAAKAVLTMDALAEEAAHITVDHGTAMEDIPFPALTAEKGALILEGVTWECPNYDGTVAGTYSFTPVLPARYTLDEGAPLPQVSVVVAPPPRMASNRSAGGGGGMPAWLPGPARLWQERLPSRLSRAQVRRL